jgi:hypothetical protein
VAYHQKLMISSSKFFKERPKNVKMALAMVSKYCQDLGAFCTLKSIKQEEEMYMMNVKYADKFYG